MQLYEKIKGESNKEYAYRVLKSNIMNLDLKPGEGLSETDIAERLGLSRTPIREVVMKLKERSPNRGYSTKRNLYILNRQRPHE